MKYILLAGLSLLYNLSFAQAPHKPNPKAKQLMDRATVMYTRSHGNHDSMRAINKTVDAAIKADSLYFEAWSNKVALVCQMGEYENAIKVTQRMQRIFPGNFEAMFNCGILQYKTDQEADARATFSKLLKQLDNDLIKYKNKPEYKAIQINKGIVLILLDSAGEGKRQLKKIYDEEKDMYTKSYIGFYINSTKQQIIDDRVPGQ